MRSRVRERQRWSIPTARASPNASPRSMPDRCDARPPNRFDRRSPHAAKRNAGGQGANPDCASLHPGYAHRMSQITLTGVKHIYRPPRGRPVLAVDEVTLEVRTREFLALLGPSGCGKSTLLYMIGGFLPIEGGRILIDGKPVAGPGPDRGIVFQHFALSPWKTVRPNVLYGLRRQVI